MLAAGDITLGILAGGRGTRLGGIDKAWIVRGGVTQVQRLSQRFASEVSRTLVSANRDPERFESLGFTVVVDRMPGLGPIGGLDALAHACDTPWLLSLPVDLVFVNDCLIQTLASAGGQGACIEDDDGVQPLVALWNVEALRAAFPRPDLSVQSLQRDMGLARIRLTGVRLGNLNTPGDLAAADATLP
ncbi:Molybdopterin-guanine dinucleotide biosynthesis protein MobA [Lysobacter dokdonensis DS-58]|uniref:Molybdopterin-guanine dinucleotide biosynthesis protein MobA n=1 Tax=Lysobacter dokdonensis DS-58 TaxID=1300345 RepID=A0A0A2WGW8_9GAMM|nr:molybdenum cofactor guanylyltransferase [Lysobacter dokdonensis]KGQ19018.1 Molybdopterin-guanine dinucleotide biosynthesis protein MobA [Lysobacter dokdonensis DS-58]